MSSPSVVATPTPLANPPSWLERVLIFLLLVVSLYTFPNQAAPDLDASWRMALGKFLLDGRQFGQDVVFTYGPLGFLMGKTYYGSAVLFYSLLVWQLFTSLCFASLIMRWGERLVGQPRFFFYLFFVLFGVTYEDAVHMIVIALVGFQLLETLGQPSRRSSVGLLMLLALLGTIKFTNLILGLCVVLVGAAHELWHHRYRAGCRFLGWFVGTFLVLWLLCRQSLLALPDYFINSWHISQGYQAVMGIATPAGPFDKALAVLALLSLYVGYNVLTHSDRPRTLARTAVLGAFLYMNWKHGFVRADGHMIGFFYCAMLPIVIFPFLYHDAQSWPRLKRWILVPAGVLCLFGIWQALPVVVDAALGIFQGKIWNNVTMAAEGPIALRQSYDDRLSHERTGAELPRTRARVEASSIDIIGYNQAFALFNDLNYTPRPIMQSYSAYTPELARLNADFYSFEHAPDYVLLRIGSIDERLSIMDDAPALNIIAHRYEYVFSEKGFHLWQKKTGPFNPAAVAPKPLLTEELPLGHSLAFKPYADRKVWLEAELSPSWLGRLRNFLYKPPHVYLEVVDTDGKTSTYRMPPPIGRTGFILNPLIDDLMGFVQFTGDRPGRTVERFTIKTAPGDEKYFAGPVHVRLASLSPSLNGRGFFYQVNRDRFYMFKSVPTAYESQAGLSEEEIDGKIVMIMHAPSGLTFDLPPHATTITGEFGFLKNAYSDGNNTNGADFDIIWSDGIDSKPLYHRFLEPVHHPEDRGLQAFNLDVTGLSGGRIYFKVGPGPNNSPAWDWVGWTGIEIK